MDTNKHRFQVNRTRLMFRCHEIEALRKNQIKTPSLPEKSLETRELYVIDRALVSYHLSVRNGEAGRHSLL